MDPVQLYISIAALGYFYLSNNATLSRIFGRNLKSRPALAERLDYVTDIIVGYLVRHRAARLRRTMPRGYAHRLSG